MPEDNDVPTAAERDEATVDDDRLDRTRLVQATERWLGSGDDATGVDETADRRDQDDGTGTARRADYVARNRHDLTSALNAAESGEVVYVPGSEAIDVGAGGFHVPDGVALVSNRGIDGAPGALLYSAEAETCFTLYGTARLAGLRLHGGRLGDDCDGANAECGVRIEGDGEVDSDVIWGFDDVCVRIDAESGARVHHNTFRDGWSLDGEVDRADWTTVDVSSD